MTVAVVPAQPRQLDRLPDDAQIVAAWAEWLRGELNPDWRPGEWNADVLLFVGDPHNPRTSVSLCRIAGCGATIMSPGYCKPCLNACRQSGMAREEFEATYTRQFRRIAAHRDLAACAVPACTRSAYSWGLCMVHCRGWAKARKRPDVDMEAWIARQKPLGDAEQCRVPGCSREKAQSNGLCRTHQRKWRLQAAPHDLAGDGTAAVERWAEHQPPFLAAHMFSLAPLSAVARLEILYVLQQRDARGQNLSPQAVRGIVGLLADLPAIALAGEAFPDPAQAGYEGTVSLLRGVQWDIATGFDQFRGVDPS